MRITNKAKVLTKQKLVKTAKSLFLKKGYEKTTTRDIAKSAGIANGTLFNYYKTKESLAMEILEQSLAEGRSFFLKRRTGEETFSEELFLLITSELRYIRPYQIYAEQVFVCSLTPFAKSENIESGEKTRINHLEIVREIIAKHAGNQIPEFILLNLYWTLYLSILAFWSKDRSWGQEETMAMIDYSIKTFVSAISREGAKV